MSAMAAFKFDGKALRDSKGNHVGMVDGKFILDKLGNKVGEFDHQHLRNRRGNVLAEIHGKDILDASGAKISTIENATRGIEGVGGTALVAMWFFFVR
jgi:sporulation protein YlmC with PRC-barrel domain